MKSWISVSDLKTISACVHDNGFIYLANCGNIVW